MTRSPFRPDEIKPVAKLAAEIIDESYDAIFIRGPQGCGKSTLANYLARFGVGVHLESDDYFLDERGRYTFDPRFHRDAHTECMESAARWLRNGSRVIISNTFSRGWELQDYLDHLGLDLPAVMVLNCTRHGWTADDYAAQTIHSVPAAAIQNLLNRWEEWEGEINLWS